MTDAPERLLKAAKELAEYASYAETVGGINVNRPQVRKWCDAVFDIIRALPEDENFEPTLSAPEALAASPEVQALIREAEARGMERAAEMARLYEERLEDGAKIADEEGHATAANMDREASRACGQLYVDFRAEAAAIRETKP